MAVAAIVAASAVLVWWCTRPDVAQRHLADIRVQGFGRIADAPVARGSGDYGPNAGAIFLGPFVADLPPLVTADIAVKPVVPPIITAEDHSSTVAGATWPDDCALSVSRITPPAPDPAWNLTERQAGDLAAGTLALLRIIVTCNG
ncbi:hypothetical protein D5S18_17850 [Nocardia panacis]|uniref:Uncharacterized protein n=1 Tax=Nocardia panacis TaxID=2340916 RepID=A0A3A4L0B9_9NOCA|nr:hypothetical protein [Nocardia panacis]RJO75217.1 hypothetical protein D5S18_17850 [Nocardia panacis]